MKKQDALRISFQAMSEIAIIGHLADTALAKVLPPELSVAGFGVLNHFVRLNVEGESPARLARAMLSRFGPRPVALSGRVFELHPLIEKSLRLALPLSTQVQARVSEAHVAAARIAAKRMRMVK